MKDPLNQIKLPTPDCRKTQEGPYANTYSIWANCGGLKEKTVCEYELRGIEEKAELIAKYEPKEGTCGGEEIKKFYIKPSFVVVTCKEDGSGNIKLQLRVNTVGNEDKRIMYFTGLPRGVTFDQKKQTLEFPKRNKEVQLSKIYKDARAHVNHQNGPMTKDMLFYDNTCLTKDKRGIAEPKTNSFSP